MDVDKEVSTSRVATQVIPNVLLNRAEKLMIALDILVRAPTTRKHLFDRERVPHRVPRRPPRDDRHANDHRRRLAQSDSIILSLPSFQASKAWKWTVRVPHLRVCGRGQLGRRWRDEHLGA